MKLPWFLLRGVFFYPITLPGWLLFLAAIAYSVWNFIRIDSHSHSVSDTLMNWVFNLFLILAGYSMIAHFTSRGSLK